MSKMYYEAEIKRTTFMYHLRGPSIYHWKGHLCIPYLEWDFCKSHLKGGGGGISVSICRTT